MLQIHCEDTAERRCLRLVGELTIYTAAEFQTHLCQALGAGTALDLHCGQVSELDTAGLQQLLLARREAERLGKSLRLLTPSPATREVLAFMHLEDAFTTAETP